MKVDHTIVDLEALLESHWKQNNGPRPARGTARTQMPSASSESKCMVLLKHLSCLIEYLRRKLRKCRIVTFKKLKISATWIYLLPGISYRMCVYKYVMYL